MLVEWEPGLGSRGIKFISAEQWLYGASCISLLNGSLIWCSIYVVDDVLGFEYIRVGMGQSGGGGGVDHSQPRVWYGCPPTNHIHQSPYMYISHHSA